MKPLFYSLLEELFELDSGSLNGEQQLTELPNWSSLMFVALIAMVDEEYEVTLAPKDVLGCASVRELAELVDRGAAERRAA